MISDYDHLYGKSHQAFSWEKVTRRVVDPVTFACFVDIAALPRIEDCSYETTSFAISQPRFGGEVSRLTVSVDGNTSSSAFVPTRGSSRQTGSSKPKIASQKAGDDDNAWIPHQFPTTLSGPQKKTAPGAASKFTEKQVKNKVNVIKSGGGTKVGSLGAFFSKSTIVANDDNDNHSVSSKSLSSRSVSERSNAEISKAELLLKTRAHHGTKVEGNTMEIDKVKMVSEFSVESSKREPPSSTGMLGQFFRDRVSPEESIPVDDDIRSMMSASTIGSKSMQILGSADRSKQERSTRGPRDGSKKYPPKPDQRPPSPILDSPRREATTLVAPLKSCMKKVTGGLPWNSKKLQFRDYNDIFEVPTLDDKEHYRDWELIWYEETELGQFRYEAFMEESGLNVDDYE